jgi:pimeloyl-ACP methyl ester carboxylesterase
MSDTIFMIHGMWGGPWYWGNYRNLFEANGFRTTATTLRYHNINPADTPDPKLGTTSLYDYAADLENEIKALDEKPILMGHSMGGLLAQYLGGRGLAKALVLLTPASPSGILALTPSVVRSFLKVQSTPFFWRRPMRLSFNAAVYSMLHLLPEQEQQAAYDRFIFESGRAAFEIGYWFLPGVKGFTVDETKVTCPVLVVAGAKDRITPASVVKKVADKYSQATYKEFPDHAHWVVGEPGWEDVAGFALDWIKKTLP